jgi:hypothetical protein
MGILERMRGSTVSKGQPREYPRFAAHGKRRAILTVAGQEIGRLQGWPIS